MKLLMILAAGLSITSVTPIFYDNLGLREGKGLVRRIPGRGGSSSAPVSKPGSGARPQAPEVKDPPPGRAGDKQTKKDQKEIQNLHHDPPYEKGYNFKRDGPLKTGDTGYWINDKAKVAVIYYGDKAPRHAVNVAWNNLANSIPEDRPITLKPASSKEKIQQRKDALRYLLKQPGIVLDEKPVTSMSHEKWWTTVIRTSSEESKYEAQMHGQAHEAVKQDPDSWTIRCVDNRSQATKDDMKKQMENGELQLYRGPNVDGMPSPKHPTADFRSGVSIQGPKLRSGKIVDAKKNTGRGKKNQKRSILGDMKGQEGAQQDSSNEYRNRITDYLDAFELVQKNTTNVIWPFIETMLAASNSSLVYEAAFAVYAHMTMAPVSVSGPFAYGMHALDDYEDRLVASGASNETMTVVYAIDGILIDLYETAWQNATAAANAVGLLEDLQFLADYLDPKDPSLLPDDFTKVDPAGDDIYDVFLPPENRFVNVTTSEAVSDVDETEPTVNSTVAAFKNTTAFGNQA
ncbi:MAG: hypothetical protein LQ338_006228 [Usnochroma carphineum]|nr:MAG: hypothetical protein LQ338_006228 [Usnochroma carphineum]